jgi:peptidoglycan/xylan/chitin deacetylase (PgdA/CDA1 family)
MIPARVTCIAAAIGMGAVAVRAAAAGGPDLATAGVLSFGFGALVTTGVVFPSLEIYGRVVLRGAPGRGCVGLTFDDGPHPVTTRRVLEALARTHHRATFFVLGEKVRRHPEVVREIAAAGHTIGIHGDRHDRLLSFRMPRAICSEITRARDAVEAATGTRPIFFRPPLGHTSITTVLGARHAGVTLVCWSARAYDGVQRRTPDAVIRRISRTVFDGAIVMLHDAAEHDDFEPAAVPALPELLAVLDQRGLSSVSLDRLLG